MAKLPVVQSEGCALRNGVLPRSAPYKYQPGWQWCHPTQALFAFCPNRCDQRVKSKRLAFQIQPVKTFERFWISRLKLDFLNKATRGKAITYGELVIVK